MEDADQESVRKSVNTTGGCFAIATAYEHSQRAMPTFPRAHRQTPNPREGLGPLPQTLKREPQTPNPAPNPEP